jgi:hypothetical protein
LGLKDFDVVVVVFIVFGTRDNFDALKVRWVVLYCKKKEYPVV